MQINDYFNRILPIVGDSFRDKKVAIFAPENVCLVADAFARCGLVKQIYFLSDPISFNSPLTWFYDQKPELKNSGEYLRKEIMSHNHLEKNWDIKISESIVYESVLSKIKEEKVDLIIALGCLELIKRVNQMAESLKIKALTAMIFDSSTVDSLVYIYHPNLPYSFSNFSNILETETCLDSNFSIFSWINAMDLILNFSKALILEETNNFRDDFRSVVLQEGRSLILRGSSNWPFLLNYLKPNNLRQIELLFKENPSMEHENLDFSSLKDKKLMMIGCGTASLLSRQLLNFVDNLFLIDCKKFSIYNPVRQLVGTKWLDKRKKSFVLRDYLEKRLDKKSIFIDALDLKISLQDQSSLTKFEEVLESYKPDLVIVSMGKTYDDNFTVCEILKKKNIKHIVPSAFPGATHYKVIAVDDESPCYECLQNNLRVDTGSGFNLNPEAREMFYTDPDDPTQPATIFETWPSTFLTLRLSVELLLDKNFQAKWFRECMVSDNCFVGANQVQKTEDGEYIYGAVFPGQVITYGLLDFIGQDDFVSCPVCGRTYFVQHKI